MLHSVLLHFSSAQHGEPVIELGVHLAQRSSAKVRGLSLVDTRRLAALSTSEAACYTHHESVRLHRVEAEQDSVRVSLSQACLAAGSISICGACAAIRWKCCPPSRSFTIWWSLRFRAPARRSPTMLRFRQPIWSSCCSTECSRCSWCAAAQQPIRRVLLVSDGTQPAARAIRQFVQQNLLPGAELRLLAIGPSEDRGPRHAAGNVRLLPPPATWSFESGWLCGSARRVLVPYAHKWGADLVVLGVPRAAPLWRAAAFGASRPNRFCRQTKLGPVSRDRRLHRADLLARRARRESQGEENITP